MLELPTVRTLIVACLTAVVCAITVATFEAVFQEGSKAELEGAEDSNLSCWEKQRWCETLGSAWKDIGLGLSSFNSYLRSFWKE